LSCALSSSFSSVGQAFKVHETTTLLSEQSWVRCVREPPGTPHAADPRLVLDTVRIINLLTGKKGKVFPYSLPSVGPGADPGVQAVSPQVT